MIAQRESMRKVVIGIALLAAGISTLAPASSQGGLTDLRDRPLSLPAYDGIASMAGVTGSVGFRVHYLKGKVRSVEPVSIQLPLLSNLASPRNSRNFESLVLTKMSNAVKQWSSIFLQPFDVEVTFELRQAELPENQRTYLVEYDQRGSITRVVITDPISSRRLGKEAKQQQD